LAVALLLAGLALLVVGGHALVGGASGLARAIGLSPLVVGLTVVSFATSAPELAVTVDASLSGSPGVAVGNIVGSNMANVLLVLGVAGLVVPLTVQMPVVRRDVPVVIALSVLLLLVSLSGEVSRLDGLLLFSLLIAYAAWTVIRTRHATADDRNRGAETTEDERPDERADERRAPPDQRSALVDVLRVAGGVGLLVLGARWLVSGATDIAADLGMSELVMGLTIVAIGTSLPELATSVVAALRGEAEMAVGNAVGSNIFNIGSVMGLTAIISPEGVPVAAAAVRFDLPVMIAVALALLPIAFTGCAIARWEAALFVVYYAAYVTYLLLDSTQHDVLPAFSTVMLVFVIPITALTLIVLATYEAGVRRGRHLAEAENRAAPPAEAGARPRSRRAR
jgi:cation:H+ antiporter